MKNHLSELTRAGEVDPRGHDLSTGTLSAMTVAARSRWGIACVVLVIGVAMSSCSAGGEGGTSSATTGTTPDRDGAAGTSGTTGAVAAWTRSLATTKEAAVDLPGYNVYRPADLAATGAPLPVIVWANGGCVRYDATWSTLLDRWARAGFVVVAITTPAEGQSVQGATSAADQALGIDWAEAQNAKPGSPYAGHLDTKRVIAAGNSCGGITSLALAGNDPRVRAVFVLSGSSVGPGASREQAAAVMNKVTVPVGLISGGSEDISSDQTLQDYELLADGLPGFRANRASGDHLKVSTDPAVLEEAAEISTNWMDLAVNGTAAALQALTNDPCSTCSPGVWTVKAKNLESLVAQS